ncbi:MAG: MaoC/PaaZ C-terminal domain-containing protein [Acidimicrobiia bacterium]
MDLSTLEGRAFGPKEFRICVEKVHDFVDAAGDDRSRWAESAPPGFVAAALFVVAPDLLELLDGYGVLHGDQSFNWSGPLMMERDVTVTGTVARVRERGDTAFVTFVLEVIDGDGGVLASGESLFLVSRTGPDAAAPGNGPKAVSDSGSPSQDQKSASRTDLVKYAAATRDWNPIHWDHGVAIGAGLDGVVVHGLLQAAWALQAVSEDSTGHSPVATAKFRFKNPLPPATAVDVVVESEGLHRQVSLSGGETVYMTANIALTEG